MVVQNDIYGREGRSEKLAREVEILSRPFLEVTIIDQ